MVSPLFLLLRTPMVVPSARRYHSPSYSPGGATSSAPIVNSRNKSSNCDLLTILTSRAAPLLCFPTNSPPGLHTSSRDFGADSRACPPAISARRAPDEYFPTLFLSDPLQQLIQVMVVVGLKQPPFRERCQNPFPVEVHRIAIAMMFNVSGYPLLEFLFCRKCGHPQGLRSRAPRYELPSSRLNLE